MTTPATGAGRFARSPSSLAAIALVVLVVAATISDADALSAFLVAVGLLVGAWPAWTMRRDRIVIVAGTIVATWLVYGLIVGSLPSPNSTGDVADWASTEGRVLVVVATIAIASAVTSIVDLRWTGRSIVLAVTAAHVLAFVAFGAGSSLPGFRVDLNGLFMGLSSSHHVVGFVAVGVLMIVLSCPSWFVSWQQAVAGLVALASIVAAGSRTSLLALLCGGAVIAWRRLDRRRFVIAVVIVALLGAALVASSARFRTTVDVMTRPEFPSEVWRSFTNGGTQGIRDMSDSAPEANILLRVALWGVAAEDFVDSPIVGIGVFRQNDDDLAFEGVRHVVFVATSGENRFGDDEPHNVLLFLGQEVGVLGVALYATPYMMAWRRTRRRDEGPDDGGVVGLDEVRLLTRATIVMAFAGSMVSSGVLATGLGLVSNAMIFAAAAVVTAARRDREITT
ncbi:O-antigen ligase family protein [Ilumatobacter fluminis]|nr:O-antigen ligase family protein [Ilumatobacter fluminis]